jgi:alpha-N-acetylglucosaminidase
MKRSYGTKAFVRFVLLSFYFLTTSMKKHSLCLLIFFSLLIINSNAFGQLDIAASKALLQRIVPNHASQFVIEAMPSHTGKDVFEIESRHNKIVLRGNNGVAIASALYYYLNNYCHAQITWNGTNLHLPKVLPKVTNKIHQQTPYEYRYYLNY